MSHLDARQRQALAQFQVLTDGADDDVAISVLDTVGWDVQRAVDLVFDTTSTSTRPTMEPFEIDDSQVSNRRGTAQNTPALFYQLTRPFLSVLAFPLHILSNIFRFVFGVLRIPVPQLRFSTLSFYRPRPRRPRGGLDRWVRELEEETGAISIGTSRISASTTATDAAGPSTLTARSQAFEDSAKVLPDFTLGSYNEILHICQKEARIGCIILVSEEHDDVAEFKRSTLTDPTFVKLLHDNSVIVWGGDVRDQEAWSAAEKLQATTYPFVAFLALQPRRTPSSSSSRSSSTPPSLTILSRHQGKSTAAGPTSAYALSEHMTNQLLPRVTPFLARIHATQRERERDRALREEQDRAFHDAAIRDRERIEQKMAEERKERELKRAEEVAEARKREREEERMVWRRWGRKMQGEATEGQGKGLRVAVRLPNGERAVRIFRDGQTLTTLYAFVDAQLIPDQFERTEDPAYPPGSAVNVEEGFEACLEAQIGSSGEGDAWWGFQLALAYPRREILWKEGVQLKDVESLRGGGQVVVEMKGNLDDGYNTEDSE